MPRRDGTGPLGTGTMTGRGLGLCSGVDAPVDGGGWGQGGRRGLGRRNGRSREQGLGIGCGFGKQVASKEALLAQKERLENILISINRQIENS